MIRWPRRRRAAAVWDDQRACQLVATTWLLYQELAPDDAIVGVSIDVITEDGEVVSYSLAPGRDEVLRFVTDFSDPDALLEAYQAARAVITDATVRGMP